jgi:hypothetical protein
LLVADLKNKLQANSKALELCHQRLNDILNLVKDRKALEDKEDTMLYSLRYWFVLVRCKILAPKSADIADAHRSMLLFTHTNKVELLSEPMKEAAQEATALALRDFADVNMVISSLSSIGWCLIALNILRRKPKMEELQMLSTNFSAIKLPDAKCIGLIRSILARASSWQCQVRKLLDPASCNTNFTPELHVLQEHLSAANSIPVAMEEFTWLENVIADGFRKHCICEGPLRMSPMLSCDSCGKWFHGTCVQVSEAEAETLPRWLCSSCSGSSLMIEPKPYSRVRRWIPSRSDDDVSSSAPNPALIWPPTGFFNESEDVEKLLRESEKLLCMKKSSEAVASPGSMDLKEHMIKPFIPSTQVKVDSDFNPDTAMETSDFIKDTSGDQTSRVENDEQDPQPLDDS